MRPLGSCDLRQALQLSIAFCTLKRAPIMSLLFNPVIHCSIAVILKRFSYLKSVSIWPFFSYM